MHEHVEAEPREHHEEELFAACHPCTDGEKHDEQRLHNVVERGAVLHEDGTCLLHVLKQIVAVELQRLAEQIVHCRLPAVGCYVAPLKQRHVIGQSLAVLLLHEVVVLLQLRYAYWVFLRHSRLYALYLPLLRSHDGILLPDIDSAEQQCRHYERCDAAPREHLSAVYDPSRKRHLNAVGERYASREEEEQRALPQLHRLALLQFTPCYEQREEQ